MTAKEQLLEIKTYEEYLEKRNTLQGLKPDKEVIEHLAKIFPRTSNTREELYKTPPKDGGTIGR